jgi:hypothetical protein
MELGMIATAAVLTSIVVVPFIFMITSSKKHKNQLKNGLKQLAATQNASLKISTMYLNFAIGIDEITRQIYFFKKIDNSEICKVIDLNQVSTCGISNQSKSIKIEKRTQEIIEKVALLFEFKDATAPEYFKLFDDNKSLQLNGALAIFQEWKTTVTALLANETAVIPLPESRSRILDFSRIIVL